MNKRIVGNMEEVIAVDYLKEHGYEIIERNFRCKQGEIDIIARNQGYLVFVEVKYRADDTYGFAGEAINNKKQQVIYKVARYYLLKNNIPYDIPMRFDVVCITGDNIELIENAFGAI